MKLRTPIGYISSVANGYAEQSVEQHALILTDTDHARRFVQEHGGILPEPWELVS